MKCIAESRTVQNTFAKTAIAAATVAVMTFSVAAPVQADLNVLYRDVHMTLDELDRAQTPAGTAAVPPQSTTESAQRLTGVLFGTLGILGFSDPGFVPPVVGGDNRLATTTMWRQAETAYQTLMLRCAYWRDNAGGPPAGSLVGNSVVAPRINAIEIGTRQNLGDLVDAPYAMGENDVMDKLDQIDYFVAVLNAPLDSYDPNRLSSTNMNDVGAEFHERVLTLCPAP
jgi:hypothetical protein